MSFLFHFIFLSLMLYWNKVWKSAEETFNRHFAFCTRLRKNKTKQKTSDVSLTGIFFSVWYCPETVFPRCVWGSHKNTESFFFVKLKRGNVSNMLKRKSLGPSQGHFPSVWLCLTCPLQSRSKDSFFQKKKNVCLSNICLPGSYNFICSKFSSITKWRVS